MIELAVAAVSNPTRDARVYFRVVETVRATVEDEVVKAGIPLVPGTVVAFSVGIQRNSRVCSG